MAVDAVKNLAYGLVSTAPSPDTTGTSMTLQTGQGANFPTAPFDASCWPANTMPTYSTCEIVRVTGVAGDTITMTRAQYGTTAQPVAAGYQFAQTFTANLIQELINAANLVAEISDGFTAAGQFLMSSGIGVGGLRGLFNFEEPTANYAGNPFDLIAVDGSGLVVTPSAAPGALSIVSTVIEGQNATVENGAETIFDPFVGSGVNGTSLGLGKRQTALLVADASGRLHVVAKAGPLDSYSQLGITVANEWQTICSFTPTVQTLLCCSVYFLVPTGGASVAAQVTYTQDGSAQTLPIYPTGQGTLAAGPYSSSPVLIDAAASDPVTVQVQSSSTSTLASAVLREA